MNIDNLRKQTPGTNNVTHFNNAGASLMPQPVIDAMQEYLDSEINIGGYETQRLFLDKLEAFYPAASKLLNCKPQEIAYTQNASRAWDIIFYSLNLQAGDNIITSTTEYASNMLSILQLAKNNNIEVRTVNNNEYGEICTKDLSKKIDDNTKLIAITHIPTNSGLINPSKAIGQIAKQHSILYLLDATQTIGQMPLDVNDIQCDFLCATGRKYLRGPRGTGFLYISESLIGKIEPIFVDLHAAYLTSEKSYELRKDARRFEVWETNLAGKAGLTAAINYAMKLGLDNTWKRIQELSIYAREKLKNIDGITLHDLGQQQCGIITLTHNKISCEALFEKLTNLNINTAVATQKYALVDMQQRKLESVLRVSIHYYNTIEEIDILLNVLSP